MFRNSRAITLAAAGVLVAALAATAAQASPLTLGTTHSGVMHAITMSGPATDKPSSWDSASLSMPKGFTLMPLDADSISYNASSKTSSLEVMVKQPIANSAVALVFSSMVLAGQKQDLWVVDGIRPDGKYRYYIFSTGSLKGDLRTNHIIKIAGKVTAKKRTQFTSTAALDKAVAGVVYWKAMDRPETWSYDSVKKKTSIMLMVNNDSAAKVKIGNCGLSLTVAGKSVTIAKSNVTVLANWYGWVHVADVPGDLRYGGTVVNLSGKLKVGGC